MGSLHSHPSQNTRRMGHPSFCGLEVKVGHLAAEFKYRLVVPSAIYLSKLQVPKRRSLPRPNFDRQLEGQRNKAHDFP